MPGRLPRKLGFLLVGTLVAMTLGPWACSRHEHDVITARCGEVRDRLVAHGATLKPAERDAMQQGLDEAVRLAEDGRLTFMALKTLEGRAATILADEILTSLEAAYLERLLDDLPHWTDESMAFRYIGGR
ncbi:MAG TPA: hypothetical protein ENK43_11445 [Planctomycetes bacterium]|nr:hypothetical protein [Planctomycetota bacterium]